MSGNLAKLVIRSFTDKEFKKEVKDSLFTAPINPEAFTKNFKVELEKQAAHGAPGRDPKFVAAGTQELKLDFILDGTGTMQGYVEVKNKEIGKKQLYLSVHDQLKAFLKCVYDYDKEMHQPRYLIILWGSEINFRCVLSNLDVNHTLFDPQGFPVRVKLSATFTSFSSPKSQLAKKKPASPDLTHYRKIKQDDRLDLMTFNIYNNSNYYLQVGRVNGLSTVRKLKPGNDLYFPPFDKNEAR